MDYGTVITPASLVKHHLSTGRKPSREALFEPIRPDLRSTTARVRWAEGPLRGSGRRPGGSEGEVRRDAPKRPAETSPCFRDPSPVQPSRRVTAPAMIETPISTRARGPM